MKIRQLLLALIAGVVVAVAGPAVPTTAAVRAHGTVKIASSAHVLVWPDGQDPWPKPDIM
jgi:hypothetical protein